MDLKRLLMVLIVFGIMAGTVPVWADLCHIPVGAFRTQTKGGWGNNCNGNNSNCIRDQYFSSCFPGGLTIGGFYTIHLDSAKDVKAYLPGGGGPNVLTQNYVNPGSGGTSSGNLGEQLTALTISLQFANCGVPGFHPFGTLVVPTGVHTPTGAFAGWTVNQIVALANTVLGGNTSGLPVGISVSNLNDVLDAINSNFDDGTHSNGYLVYPGCDHILPVEFASFNATGRAHEILVSWRTASEANVGSYELTRSSGGEWQTIAVISGQGDSPSGHAYQYGDDNVTVGTMYDYRLLVHEVDGTVTMQDAIASASPKETVLPGDYALEQNYPNPFNPNTTIAFTLPEAASVTLTVFDVNGRAIRTLVNGAQTSGLHTVNFDAANLAAGVYFYRLDAPNFSATRKLVLLK